MKLSLSLLFHSYLLHYPLASAASQVSSKHYEQRQKRTRPKAHELTSQYSFEQYIIDFQKSNSFSVNSEEYATKKHIFETNLRTILKHNENVRYDLETGQHNGNSNGHSYHMGLNHLVDLTEEELQSSFYGYDNSLHGSYASSFTDTSTATATATATSRRNLSSTYEKDLPFNITDVSKLPESFNLEKKTPVKNQKICGSCWAFSAIAALEGHLALRSGNLDVLSPQELVSCVENPSHCGGQGGCTGATTELAYEYIAVNGILKEESFPYAGNDKITCPLHDSDNADNTLDIPKFKNFLRHKDFNLKKENNSIVKEGKKKDDSSAVVAKVEGYATLPSNDYKALMNAVAKHGPAVIAIAADGWSFYEGGVFTSPTPNTKNWSINHGVVVEGYGTDEVSGEDYWLVRNSWGESYGEDGYIRLKRVDPETLDDPESDCGYDTTPLDGIACELNPDGSHAVIQNVKVCGTSGILFHPVVPVGGYFI
jgi:cathepsin L